MAACVVCAAVVGAIVLGVVVLDHAGDAVYGIPRWGVVMTVALMGSSAVGGAVLAWSRQVGFGAVVLSAAATGALGILAVFSFGLLALLAATGLLAWAASGTWAGARNTRAAVGAVLAGAPLPVLVVLAASGPLVDCQADGVTAGENVFLGVGSSGGSATATADGTGRVEGGSYEYSYTCRDGTLVRFELRWR